jgi:hypothetical protein
MLGRQCRARSVPCWYMPTWSCWPRVLLEVGALIDCNPITVCICHPDPIQIDSSQYRFTLRPGFESHRSLIMDNPHHNEAALEEIVANGGDQMLLTYGLKVIENMKKMMEFRVREEASTSESWMQSIMDKILKRNELRSNGLDQLTSEAEERVRAAITKLSEDRQTRVAIDEVNKEVDIFVKRFNKMMVGDDRCLVRRTDFETQLVVENELLRRSDS